MWHFTFLRMYFAVNLNLKCKYITFLSHKSVCPLWDATTHKNGCLKADFKESPPGGTSSKDYFHGTLPVDSQWGRVRRDRKGCKKGSRLILDWRGWIYIAYIFIESQLKSAIADILVIWCLDILICLICTVSCFLIPPPPVSPADKTCT